MKRSTVFMYSGQGSQYYHMSRELYEQHPRYRLWMDHCDDIAAPVLGRSLLATIFDDRMRKSDPFDSLADSSAALLCVEYSLTRLVLEMGYQADFLLGYSLGEITAAVVAEVFSLELGLTFAVEFARLLERQTPHSGMLAIVGSLDLLRTRAPLFAHCWVTGTNFDDNFVVSGHVSDIEEVQCALERENIVCQRLPVNCGVHTELIDPVKEQCQRFLGALNFSPPQIPLISSISTGRVDAVSAERIWSAMRMPVAFSQTIEKMTADDDFVFIDVGPSATLATFVKYILPANSRSTQTSIINRFGNDLKSMEAFRTQMACLQR